MNTPTLQVGVLAAIDPAAWSSDAVATVFRTQISARRDDIRLDFRTVVDGDHLRRWSTWNSTPITAWRSGVQAVIVDEAVDATARAASGLDDDVVVVDTNLFGDVRSLCSLFATTADTTALDTRRRMLSHLGVLAAPDGVDDLGAFSRAKALFGGSLSVTDRLLIAREVGAAALADDPDTLALIAVRSDIGHATGREFDRICSKLDGLEPSVAAHAAGLQQRVASLEAEVEHLHDLLRATERRSVDQLESAAARERSLANRLETATLNLELMNK